MTNLSKGKFSALQIMKPPSELIEAFHQIAAPILSQLKTLAAINIELAKTRDLLLPRLISGKLRVEDLEIEFPPGMREEG